MMRPLLSAAWLIASVGAVFLLAPGPAHRDLPTPEPVTMGGAGGVLVIDLVDGSGQTELDAISGLLGVELGWTHPLAREQALASGWVPDLSAAALALDGDDRVEVVEPELEMLMYAFPNDPLYDKQWNLKAMGAPEGWARTPQGRGVVVAVIDTGVTQVEDLANTRVLKGASFVPGVKTAADDQGHGTHVAGTIAQSTNNGVGVAGIAPEATILPVKVLSAQGGGRSPWIAAGIHYAVNQGADVINLSLGGSYSLVIHNAIRRARDKGVLVVAAAGNSGRKGVGYPGALRETIGVSATGPSGSLAPYSSWGKGVDLAAPGGDKRQPGGGILQDTVGAGGAGHQYASFQGTSMATPHVAGAAAVLLSTGMAPDAVERTLLETASGQGYNNKFGHGQLDLGAALGQAASTNGALLFVLGAWLALLVGRMGGASARWLGVAGLTAGLVAGGAFVLDWIPLGGGLWVQLLGAGLVRWPAVLLGPSWVQFPLWLSVALPLLVAFVFGAQRSTRAVAMGVSAGFAAALFHGAALGTLDPSWVPFGLGTVWLVSQGTLCVLLAMGLVGTEKLDREAV